MIGLWVSLAVGLLAFSDSVRAIGQATCVSFSPSSSSFPLASNGVATPILLSEDEWGGVQRAAGDFAMDIHRVSGVMPLLFNATMPATQSNLSLAGARAIIVGTLGQSSLIDEVVNNTGLDVSSVEGHWEAFMTQEVSNPLPGISSAYVMIGADKRGTIYAMYDHSEQIGVSPWYWWADVPIKTNSEIYAASSGCAHGSPTVQYRGIFLNDEAPALTEWAMVRYTNGTGAPLTGSPFNHYFYTSLFELLLRMKANYLWPAMWSSAFGVDDSLNQPLANWYVDALRKGPWDYSTNKENIYPFWVEGAQRGKDYENISLSDCVVTVMALAGGQDIQLLEQVISDQRTILSDTFPGVNVTTIPQMWCLYKEVLGYYEDGMTVPDDIALLWTDDNYGNMERLPIVSERGRSGGAGVYYHYDYVGSPRNYKWMSYPISKTFEQMSLTTARNANRIWIVNVGDLKPYEMEIEFFITYGWDTSIWNYDNLDSFVSMWAQREFSLSSADAVTVAGIIANVTRFNANCKPELLNATTFSLTNYREAQNMLAMWEATNASATAIQAKLQDSMLPAYFQLVYHPAFLSANNYADLVEYLFEEDWNLEVEYDSQLDGKWAHMMSQTHTLYVYWQEPYSNAMPPVSRQQPYKQALAGVMRLAIEGSQGGWPGDNQYDCAQGYGCPNPTVTIDPALQLHGDYQRVMVDPVAVIWLRLTECTEQYVYASVDWSQLEDTTSANAFVNFNATAANQPMMSQQVYFTANYTSAPSDFTGFVEGDGTVSIEAAHAARNASVDGITWFELPGYGRTLSAVTPWPRGGDETNFTVGTGPSIEYDFYTFNSIGGNISVTAYVAPSLNALGPDRPLAIGMQIDSDEPQVSYYIPNSTPGTLPDAWSQWVSENIVYVPMNFTATPGAHTLTVWMIEPTVILQKIVIDTGGVLPSYLGPPESIRV
ncbi:glycoside hydrolase family 115 protein [Fomitopsis serialis]|uniref:glycoside hydrolase family 115 protein n=1 Tax=Fomitopsis serialis TaxID=139415 RepID=UPI0020089D48|nr:glycoside hydrolase family 115 protein [Neoantrodia serialis]KAH9922243.1 glycoside hydrolase family 115 protein [Neoantrodia serialis]